MISLGGNIGIGLTVRLNNQFTAQANQIAGSFQSLYGNARRAIQQNLQAARQLGVGMSIVGGLASKAFLGATKEAAEFDYSLVGIQAITNSTAGEIANLKKQILALNIESIYGAKEIASSAYELTKAGFSIQNASDALRGVTQLGAAADIAIGGKEGAAGIMAHTLNTFMLRANAAERVADIMAFTANKSSVDMKDLAQSINYVGSEATTLKLPLETVSAMLGVLGNAGIRGSSAGVALANMLRYLGVAVTQFRTKKQGKMLEALGIDPNSVLDATGELKKMTDVVDIFMQSLSKKRTPEQVALLAGLFNIRGSRAMTKLLQNPEIGMNFREFEQAILSQAEGTAARIAKMKIDTPFGQIEVLESTMENMRILIGDVLLPIFDKLLRITIKIVDGLGQFVKTPIGKAAVVLLAGISAATAAAGLFLVAFTTIKLLTLASTVSFANMGKALTWAWNSSAAAATRYLAIAQGATWVGPGGGVFTRKGMKGFQKNPIGPLGGGAGLLGTIKNFVNQIIRGVGPLGRVFNIFKGLGGVALGLVTVFTMMVGFGNIVKGVVYALGTFMHALFFAYDFVTNILKGPAAAFEIAKTNFATRNNAFRESLGFEPMPIDQVARRMNTDPFERTQGLKERMEQQMQQKKQNITVPPGQVTLDGKVVGDVLFQHNMRYLEGSASFTQ